MPGVGGAAAAGAGASAGFPAEEPRLRAIDSIPFYVDHALCFLAIVPKVEHKDLPGTYCTYKSWQERGWCITRHGMDGA